jgi:hypothetical protein
MSMTEDTEFNFGSDEDEMFVDAEEEIIQTEQKIEQRQKTLINDVYE